MDLLSKLFSWMPYWWSMLCDALCYIELNSLVLHDPPLFHLSEFLWTYSVHSQSYGHWWPLKCSFCCKNYQLRKWTEWVLLTWISGYFKLNVLGSGTAHTISICVFTFPLGYDVNHWIGALSPYRTHCCVKCISVRMFVPQPRLESPLLKPALRVLCCLPCALPSLHDINFLQQHFIVQRW